MSPTGGTAPEACAFAFPWDDALRLGLHALRWTPRAFWAATPRELAAAAGLTAGAVPGRDDLERLLAAFPDSFTPDPFPPDPFRPDMVAR